MISGPIFASVLMMLFAQGNGEALDTVPTATYWQTKHVEVTTENMLKQLSPAKDKVDITAALSKLGSDQFAVREAAQKTITEAGLGARSQLEKAKDSTEPEVANFAKELLAHYAESGKEVHVRKLMAIRTLGERKEKIAVPVLEGLVKSTEPFVAEYAGQAIAQINGKPWKVTVNAADLEADVWALPVDTGFVAQLGNAGGVHVNAKTMMEAIPASFWTNEQMGMNKELLTKEKMTEEATGRILEVVEKFGNARFDSLTLAFSDNMGQAGGWIIFNGRGQLEDGEKMIETFENIPEFMGMKLVKTERDGLKIFEPKDANFVNLALVLKGDQQLAFIVCFNAETMGRVKDSFLIAYADKTGKGQGGIAENATMTKLLKQVDHTQTVWAAVSKIPDDFKRELPAFAGFETATGTIAVKDDVLQVQLTGEGADKEAVAASVEGVNKLVQDGLTGLKSAPPEATELVAPVSEILESIKVTAHDTQAQVVGQVKASTVNYGMGMLFIQMREQEKRMQSYRAHRVEPVTTEPATTEPGPDQAPMVVPGQ